MEYDQMTKKDEKEASTQNTISSGVSEGLTYDVSFQYQMEPFQEDGWYKSFVEAEKTM